MIGPGNSTAVGIGNINYLIQFLQETTELFPFIVTTSGKQVSQSYHSYITAIASHLSVKQLESADMLTETLLTCKPLTQVIFLKI